MDSCFVEKGERGVCREVAGRVCSPPYGQREGKERDVIECSGIAYKKAPGGWPGAGKQKSKYWILRVFRHIFGGDYVHAGVGGVG